MKQENYNMAHTPDSSTSEIIITLDQLDSKDYPEQVLITSFEFLLTSLIKEYSKIKNIKSPQEYNLSPYKMRLDHILVSPYFVAVADGNTQSLFKLFQDFYTFTYGIVSMKIYDIIKPKKQNDNVTFQFLEMQNEIGPYSIDFKPTVLANDFETIKTNLKKTLISFGDNKIEFGKIGILNDLSQENLIVKAIEEDGINTIKEQALEIIAGNNYTIDFKSRYYKSYRYFQDDGVAKKITYDEVTQSEKPFPTTGTRSKPKLIPVATAY